MRSFCVSYSGQSQQVLTVLWTNHNWKKQRSVVSRYHGSKMSISQQPFLTETAICIVEWWKKSMGYPFCSWVQSCTGKSYLSVFSLFSCHICRTAVCWCYPMATWRNDFFSILHVDRARGGKTYVIKLYLVVVVLVIGEQSVVSCMWFPYTSQSKRITMRYQSN